MATRNPDNDLRLLRDQHSRLKEALESFYAGQEVQALNIAITLRVLVHQTSSSHSLLFRLSPKYWQLMIYHKRLSPKAVFSVPFGLQVGGDGTKRLIRGDFNSPSYQMVTLQEWWNEGYQPLGSVRLSKRDIVLNVADKDGGAHIDEKVPDTHATLSEPPFLFGLDNGGEKLFMRPNMAYGITAQAGCEMQEYLERHFLNGTEPS